jgi:hypothetical protein
VTPDPDPGRIEQLLRDARGRLSSKDYTMLKGITDTYSYLVELLSDENITRGRLREAFGYPPDDTDTDGGEDADPESPDEGADRQNSQG